MKIALYRNMEFPCEIVQEYFDDPKSYWNTKYVRISEPMEIEFIPLKDNAVIEKALVVLDNLKSDIVREYTGKLQDIDRRKAELQALTHTPEES